MGGCAKDSLGVSANISAGWEKVGPGCGLDKTVWAVCIRAGLIALPLPYRNCGNRTYSSSIMYINM